MAARIRCEVVAPSKLQKPSGERVKTGAKDAIPLATLLRLHEITSVSIPPIDQEAARDLVVHVDDRLERVTDQGLALVRTPVAA